jgi:hypothetical protein
VAGPQSFVFHRRKNSPGPHLEAGELASIRCVYLVTVSYRVFVVVVLHIEYIIDLAKPNQTLLQTRVTHTFHPPIAVVTLYPFTVASIRVSGD